MQRLSCLFLFIALTTAQAGDKAEPGFKAIFNGTNFDGWQTKAKKPESLEGKTEAFKGRFKIADKKIVIDYTTKGDSYIETTKEFAGDVHIKFDFLPGAACNNDFFLRGTKFDITLKLKGVKEKEWNTLEIITTGDKIEHKLNGESARKSDAKGKASAFAIRAEFGVIEIKNIRIKEGS